MKKLLRILFGVMILLGTLTSAASAETYDEEVRAVELLNQFRAEHGLEPFQWNPESDLQNAANVRAYELTQQFSHTRPDGTSCFSIFDEYGIKFRTCAENIAMGTNVDAEQAMEMWINSPGHYANMANPALEEVGFAYWLGDDEETVYWVQLFLTR